MSVSKDTFADLQDNLMRLTENVRNSTSFDPSHNPFHAQVLKHLTTAHKYFVAAQQLRGQNRSYDAYEPLANAAAYLHASNQEWAKTQNNTGIPISETARISRAASKLASNRGN